MQRLGRNVSGYAGEGIDYPHFEVEFARQAGERGWREEVFHEHGGVRISAWCRGPAQAARRVYISAGIHGDEPAGPLALLRLVRADHWPDQCEFLLCPALNPYGLAHNQRVNRDGLDLNRQYLKPVAPEVVSHCAWLTEQGRFDLALCLHEDWEAKGFYLYELNPDRLPSRAPAVMSAVGRCCPIDASEAIDGRPAQDGVIRPDDDPRVRTDWPEAFYLFTVKTRLSYTFEAPSDFPMGTRVEALATAVSASIAG